MQLARDPRPIASRSGSGPAVPDATRHVEGRGFGLLQRMRDEGPDEPVLPGDWRSLGLPSCRMLLLDEDIRFVDSQVERLDPGLGYGTTQC